MAAPALALRCPFCQSGVPEQAVACAACGRDFAGFRSLMRDVASLELRVKKLEAQLEDAPVRAAADADLEILVLEPIERTPHWAQLGVLAVVVLALLLFGHWILLFVYDASVVWLRLVSIALPLLAAWWVNRHGTVTLFSNVVSGSALAVVAVAGMLGITAYLDQVAWLPENLRDWRETLEYTLSIGLAWVTGQWLGSAVVHARRMVQLQALRLRKLREGKKIKIDELTEKLQKFGAAAAPVASGLMAAYTGLKSIIGGGD